MTKPALYAEMSKDVLLDFRLACTLTQQSQKTVLEKLLTDYSKRVLNDKRYKTRLGKTKVDVAPRKRVRTNRQGL